MRIICHLTAIILIWNIFPPPINASSEDKIHVVFINPGFSNVHNPTGGFWLSVSAFMLAAAADLNMDLEILYCDRNHIKMKRLAKEVVSRKNPPDYLVVVNEKLSAGPIVMDADSAGVKVFVMLNRFEGDQYQKMGQPRHKYKNWIGSLIPDNRFAGYQTAKLLIDQALKAGIKSPDGRLHIIGFSGDYITQASLQRVDGLKQAVSEYPNVDLEQVIPCNWSKDAARSKTPKILKRYPETDAIWCANDPIAVGALEGAVAAGRTPGKDIFLGGSNWDPPGLEKVKTGEIVTSVGGHFMTGGWVMVLLYDYHHGRDFAEAGTQLQYKIFGALHSGNIHQFLNQFGDRDWRKIDFTNFSKVLQPDTRHYQFNVESILEAHKYKSPKTPATR
jgi:ABC-type sugar transport system substrate-binding protein